MDQPKIPTLKDSQKPQVKIKGLAAGLSLLDRLKQFKKKDLAFILAGLGTLFMAPLAEHFMMAPESGEGIMQQGWDGKAGKGIFGSGSSPYESGITGLAPGGAIGGGGDIITPLNVRDPSALVMGPGAQQQPPAGSLAPQTAPSSAKEPDLKDALANAAARAAGAATRRAPVPVPKPGMTGSGLRGLGVASGGSSAGAGLGPINSNLAPNKAAGSNSLGDVRPATGYRGVAGARGPGTGSNAAERLKQAAGGAGDVFNKAGAGGALETAAAQQIPGGGAGFGGAGGGGAGAADKGPGGNNSNGSKSTGESLEFLRQKQEMEKTIDLKWKMKEKRAMFPLELQQEAAKTAVMKGVVEPLAGQFGELIKGSFSGSQEVFKCANGFSAPKSRVALGDHSACGGKAKDGEKSSYYMPADGSIKDCNDKQSVGQSPCVLRSVPGGSDKAGEPERGAGPDPYSSIGQGGANYKGMDLTTICQKLTQTSTEKGMRPGPEQAHLLAQAKRLAIGLEMMDGKGAFGSGSMMTACGATAADNPIKDKDRKISWNGAATDTPNLRARQTFIRDKMLNGADGGVVPIMSNTAQAWAAANKAANVGIGAQAEAAKTQDPSFKEVEGQIAANLNNAKAGSNDGSGNKGFDSLNAEKLKQIETEAATTGALLNQVSLPSDADLAKTGATDLATAVSKLGGEAPAIYGDLKSLTSQQRTVLQALQAEQGNYPARATRAATSFQEGTKLKESVAGLDPKGGIDKLYPKAKAEIEAARKQKDPAPANNPALGKDGTIATTFSAASDSLGKQIGDLPSGGQGAAGTGWAKSVSEIMGVPAK